MISELHYFFGFMWFPWTILRVDGFLSEYFVGVEVWNKHTSDAAIGWRENGANISLVVRPNEYVKRVISFHVLGLPRPVPFTAYVASTKRALLINGRISVAFRPSTRKIYHNLKIECELHICVYFVSPPALVPCRKRYLRNNHSSLSRDYGQYDSRKSH